MITVSIKQGTALPLLSIPNPLFYYNQINNSNNQIFNLLTIILQLQHNSKTNIIFLYP